MRPIFRFVTPALSAIAAMAMASGCIIHNEGTTVVREDPNAPGDISFLWSFDGESRCASAGVASVGVQVLTASATVTAFEDVVDCLGGGLTLTDFAPGTYELWLDAFSVNGALLYQGEATVRVAPGVDNDIGTVELSRIVQRGSVAFYWGFRYPTDDNPVFDCDVAGVSEIDVFIDPVDGASEGFAETLPCDQEGIAIDNLIEGDYRVELFGYGRYQGEDLALYETAFDVTVPGNQEAMLGDILLDRIFESFGDIEVSWTLPEGTCAELGVTALNVSIRRVGSGLEDDTFTIDCDRAFALRQTFVPGAYVVDIVAAGNGNATYLGAATVNVAPNAIADTTIGLVFAE